MLFPESFIPCYPRGLDFKAVVGKRTDRGRDMWLDYWSNSPEITSEHIKHISDAVRSAGLMVALGITEKESLGGTLHCSLLYFGKDGSIVGKHRKLKLTGLARFIWGESDDSTLTSLVTPLGKVLAGPLWNDEGLLTAELDFALQAKSKLDFDCIRHYARPDVFEYRVNKQPATIKID
ncbi:hypothetical protein GCM10027291_02870 [Telluribacter humicola]